MAALLSLTAAALSQTGTATIRGTVSDAAQASVPGAGLTLTSLATNIAHRSTSSDVGFYLFAGVPPGEYRLAAEAKGFKKWSATVAVMAGQVAVVDLALEVGSVDTIVEVRGVAPVITTESSEVGDVKDALRIQQLPLNGRSVTNLFDLTPGVEGGGNPRVNGLKVGSAEMTLDGMSIVDRFGGGMARVQPGLDTVQEFRVETVGSGAQFSRPATITLVTKSGTNQLHGSIFETFRNNAAGLRARARQDGNTATFYVRNEYGITGGGPVWIPKLYDGRNRTFWFAAFEGLRDRRKTYYSTIVPTEAMWNGDFSDIVDNANRRTAIYDPLTTDAKGLRTPFTGNLIPKARFNPVYGVIQSVTHAPTNSANPYRSRNMEEYYPNRLDSGNLTFKGDQKISDKENLSVRFTRSTRNVQTLGGVFGGPKADLTNGFGTSRGDYYVYNGTVRDTRTFTPTFLSELMLAVHRSPKSTGTMADFTDWQSKLGFPNPFGATGWPTMYAGSFGWDGDNRKEEKLTAYNLEENLTWVRGRHTVRFGGKFRMEQNNIQELAQAQGDVSFSGAWTSLYDPARDGGVAFTGDAVAAMALGLPSYVGANYNRGFFYFRQKEIGLYAQDTWKVTPRLTVDAGLRWDKWTPYREKWNRMTNVDLRSIASTFQVVSPGDVRMEDMPGIPAGVLGSWKKRGLTWKTANEVGLPDNLVAADNNNFGPRLGFAYKLNNRTVLRGGYGEFFWTMPLSQILQAARRNPPLSLLFTTDVATIDGTGSYGIRTAPLANYYIGKVGIDTNGIISIPSSARNMSTMDPFDWKDNRARTFHFTIERELMSHTALRLTYTGSQGRDLEQAFNAGQREAEYNYVARTGQAPPANRDELRANKNWNLSPTNHTGYSNTHSLQAEIERRFYKGLSFQAFYVFSRSLTTTDTGGFSAGGGAINAINGIYAVAQNDQILGGGKMTYDQLLRLGYQNSTNVPAHHLRYNGLYELPFGKGKKFAGGAGRALDALIGGWQLAGTGDRRSGYWMGVSAGRYLFGDPSLSPDQRLTMTFSGRNRRLWFAGDFDPTLATNVDQAALQKLVPLDRAQRIVRPVGSTFANQLPQVLANGTVRNTAITDTVNWNARAFYQGPRASSTDLSLFKNFSLTEKVKLRFTADFFNAFNHPIEASPDTTTGLQDLSTQTNEPRIIQFSLRLSW